MAEDEKDAQLTLTKQGPNRNLKKIVNYMYLDKYAEFAIKLQKEKLSRSSVFKSIITAFMNNDRMILKFLRKHAINTQDNDYIAAKRLEKQQMKEAKKAVKKQEEYLIFDEKEVGDIYDELEFLEETKNERL